MGNSTNKLSHANLLHDDQLKIRNIRNVNIQKYFSYKIVRETNITLTYQSFGTNITTCFRLGYYLGTCYIYFDDLHLQQNIGVATYIADQMNIDKIIFNSATFTLNQIFLTDSENIFDNLGFVMNEEDSIEYNQLKQLKACNGFESSIRYFQENRVLIDDKSNEMLKIYKKYSPKYNETLKDYFNRIFHSNKELMNNKNKLLNQMILKDLRKLKRTKIM